MERKVTAIRFIKFAIVGGSGALLQIGLFSLLTRVLHVRDILSLCIAITMVFVWNFTANLKWTFRGKV
tara:strand:+ start:248 stop:451 length:204 start_codon:yes stop_codon:yes gene_type:complete